MKLFDFFGKICFLIYKKIKKGMKMKKLISIVVPVFNEEEAIDCFLNRIYQTLYDLNYEFEFIFVDDGSQDSTVEKLLYARENNDKIKIISFSRNFGKEVAMVAGFKAASGEAVIPMDVDLQDPPELIKKFIEKWEEGYDVVIGVREQRKSDTLFKRKTAELFYSFFNSICGKRLVPNAGDYRLMSRNALEALNTLNEQVRFTKGLYAWIGFKQAIVTYERPARIAGTSKFNGWKLWNFALDGITSFSTVPLRIWSYIGILVAFIGFVFALFLICRTLLIGSDVPGYASIMVVILFLGGLILISLGIIGEYLGRIYEETKRRPLYIVKREIGFK